MRQEWNSRRLCGLVISHLYKRLVRRRTQCALISETGVIVKYGQVKKKSWGDSQMCCLSSPNLRHGDVIAENNATLTRYTDPSTLTASQHAAALTNKSFRCGEIYEEYVWKVIFVKGLQESNLHTMRLYSSMHSLWICTTRLVTWRLFARSKREKMAMLRMGMDIGNIRHTAVEGERILQVR